MTAPFQHRTTVRVLAAGALTVLLAAPLFWAPPGALAQGGDSSTAPHPANKVAVAASGLEMMGAPVVEGAKSETHRILTAAIKTSGPTDLLLGLTLECALWTDVTTIGNDESEAVATVKSWILLDGRVVPVSSDDRREAGKVVFCNRAFKTAVTDLEDEDAVFEHFLRTRAANAFDWVALNVGPGTHSIVVLAQLESQVTGIGMAKAAVGKRSLIVEPVKLANDAAF